jgi:hypothetical protein
MAQDPRYTNAYNFVHLNLEAGQGVVYLRKWSDPRNEWVPDFDLDTPGLFPLNPLPKELGKMSSYPSPAKPQPATGQIDESRDEKKQTHLAKLRQEYKAAIRNQYRRLKIQGLAPLAAGGATDLVLPDIYVPLRFREGLEEPPEIEPYESKLPPKEDIQSSSVAEDQLRMRKTEVTPVTEKEGIRPNPIQAESTARDVSRRVVDIWDGLATGLNVILGEAGAGKTITISSLALALAGEPGIKPDPRFDKYLPIVASLAKYSNRKAADLNLELAEHLCRDQFERPEFGDLLQPALKDGNCVVLLDGLDETNDPSQIMRVIEDFVAQYGKQNYIVVTSRKDAYVQAGVEESAKHLEIVRMDDFQQDRFIDQWYVARRWERESQADKLKQRLKDNQELADLAKNPLMLTIIIQVHWCTREVPQKSVELYEAMIDTLIKYWRSIENLDLATIKRILQPIAYRMLELGNRVIGKDDLVNIFTAQIRHFKGWDQFRAQKASEQWLYQIWQQSGLLAASGKDKQTGDPVFEFSHQQFAEYLAAAHLKGWVVRDGYEAVLKRHIHKASSLSERAAG